MTSQKIYALPEDPKTGTVADSHGGTWTYQPETDNWQPHGCPTTHRALWRHLVFRYGPLAQQ